MAPALHWCSMSHSQSLSDRLCWYLQMKRRINTGQNLFVSLWVSLKTKNKLKYLHEQQLQRLQLRLSHRGRDESPWLNDPEHTATNTIWRLPAKLAELPTCVWGQGIYAAAALGSVFFTHALMFFCICYTESFNVKSNYELMQIIAFEDINPCHSIHSLLKWLTHLPSATPPTSPPWQKYLHI